MSANRRQKTKSLKSCCTEFLLQLGLFFLRSSQEAIRKARVGPLCLILNLEKTRGCYYIKEEQVHLINSLQKFRFHIGPLGFESSMVVNSGSSFSSFVNVDFTQNHINHFVFCVFWFNFFTFFLLIIIICCIFHNKIVLEYKLLDLKWKKRFQFTTC